MDIKKEILETMQYVLKECLILTNLVTLQASTRVLAMNFEIKAY